jgi:DNA repair protein RadD
MLNLIETRYPGEAPPLRPHQTTAWLQIQRHWANKRRRVCAVAPTGAGKSRLGREAAMSTEHPLCVVHTLTLLEQNSKTICRSVMVHSLVAMVEKFGVEKTRELVGPVTLVIHDEAHHFCADKWAIIHEIWPDVRVLGLTATPQRGDGRPMRPYYDEIVRVSNYQALIGMGYLVPARVITDDSVSMVDGEVKRVHRTSRGTAASAFFELAAHLQTIIYCEDLSHARETCATISKAGYHAAVIDGSTPDAERERLLDGFKSGTVQVLVNVSVLIEGVDLPCTQCIILWASCATIGAYLQTCGRGLRASDGKEECLIIDMSGASLEFGAPDIDREYSLDGTAIASDPAGYKCVCAECWRGHGVHPPPEKNEEGEVDLSALNKLDDPEAPTYHGVICDDGHIESARAAGLRRVAALDAVYKSSPGLMKASEFKSKSKVAMQRGAALEPYLGSLIWIMSAGETGKLPCAHCARERPRNDKKASFKQKNRKQHPLVNIIQELLDADRDLREAIGIYLQRHPNRESKERVAKLIALFMLKYPNVLEHQKRKRPGLTREALEIYVAKPSRAA